MWCFDTNADGRLAALTVVGLAACGTLTSASSGQCEAARLLASDGEASDAFGKSVALGDEVALVGAPSGSRAAYVYRFNGAQWLEEAKLLPICGSGSDFFGVSTGINSDLAVVGASLDEQGGLFAGAVHIYRFDGSDWAAEQKLLGTTGARLGWAVAAGDDRIVVGAYAADDMGEDSGAAYVFAYSRGTWIEEQKLLPDDGEAGDWFGYSVAIADTVVVVGAPMTDDSAGLIDIGSAYVFRYDGAAWEQEDKLTSGCCAPGDTFGHAVAVGSDVIVVGAPLDDDLGPDAGAAYVYQYDGGQWPEVIELLAFNGSDYDSFGTAVAVWGDSVVIGAPGCDDACPPGEDPLLCNSGAVYLYSGDEGEWELSVKFITSDDTAGDEFGRSVGISGETVVAGALGDDDLGLDSGSAYVFNGWSENDCNGNWIPDECDIASCDGDPACDDCNENGVPDGCDIADGTSEDINGNGIPDECECLGDLNGDGVVDTLDLVELLASWDLCGLPADINCDGIVDVLDLLILLGHWGPCPN